MTPLAYLKSNLPDRESLIALLEQAPDAEKASFLVKARLIFFAATNTANQPSCLQARLARDLPLPRVTSGAITGNKKTKERRRKFLSLVTFLLGMEGGPKGNGMPQDVFLIVMDYLMPFWDPLRKHDFTALPLRQALAALRV